jgi:hypothetical protein
MMSQKTKLQKELKKSKKKGKTNINLKLIQMETKGLVHLSKNNPHNLYSSMKKQIIFVKMKIILLVTMKIIILTTYSIKIKKYYKFFVDSETIGNKKVINKITNKIMSISRAYSIGFMINNIKYNIFLYENDYEVEISSDVISTKNYCLHLTLEIS